METKLFMGCDIAQDTFAFCLRDQSKVVCQGEVSNSKKAIQAWLKELKQIYVDLSSVIFCLEHTGIYGMILMRTLYTRSLIVCVEGASNIKLSLGLQRGKNDRWTLDGLLNMLCAIPIGLNNGNQSGRFWKDCSSSMGCAPDW
ncbi:MAG: transposase [Saprospiraceae bacterium]|nr:transposase [Candidatus Opimibacter skivensis]